MVPEAGPGLNGMLAQATERGFDLVTDPSLLTRWTSNGTSGEAHQFQFRSCAPEVKSMEMGSGFGLPRFLAREVAYFVVRRYVIAASL